jgi:hypothetical protein
MNQSNLYIFVLWERARENEQNLINKINEFFEIRDMYEIKWNEQNFPNNLKRFYGPGKIGDVEKKTRLCKTGAFLLIIISDHNPKFGKRRTSKGMELVNINLFENKKKFREQTKKGYAIHSSITEQETNDDLTMLLGKNLSDIKKSLSEKWDGNIKKIESDIVGQNGWTDMNELLYVLNSTVNYVVIRNFEDISKKNLEYQHNDVDIITDEPIRIPYIANGGKAPFNEKFPHQIKIGEKLIPFDFGYPEDGYYDEKWLRGVLKRRVPHDGFYIPSKEDYFYTLLYHAVIHQKVISIEYKNKLKNLSEKLSINNISQKTFENIQVAKIILEEYMKKNGYHHTDSTIYKIKHNRITRIFNTSIMLWKTQGINFLLTAIKGKIRRTIKSNNQRITK